MRKAGGDSAPVFLANDGGAHCTGLRGGGGELEAGGDAPQRRGRLDIVDRKGIVVCGRGFVGAVFLHVFFPRAAACVLCDTVLFPNQMCVMDGRHTRRPSPLAN
jgi:hypothetical protein